MTADDTSSISQALNTSFDYVDRNLINVKKYQRARIDRNKINQTSVYQCITNNT